MRPRLHPYHLVTKEYKTEFNRLAGHPLQTWEWGEFKAARGAKVVRLGRFQQDKLVEAWQFFIHRLPLGQKLIYWPRGRLFTADQLAQLVDQARQAQALMVKIEPYVVDNRPNMGQIKALQKRFSLTPSPQPLFPKYTLRLDLTQGEERILANLHPKTRYNIRLATRRGVKVVEDTSLTGVKEFVRLISLTTKRHRFAAHSPDYYQDMFKAFAGSGTLRLLKAVYQGKTIAAWILFDWQDVLYYPYGASDYAYRRLMASNLLAWQAIKLGLNTGKRVLDFWGTAPPDFAPNHPWAGFTRFKLSYGASYYRLVGSWDLIIKPIHYRLYNLAYSLRRWYLKVNT